MKRSSSKDISKEDLEKLVKVKGDGIVTYFVRFKRLHKCNDYKDASNKAALRMSIIKGGRPLEDGEYAAVIRLRLLVYFIPLIALLLFLLLWFTNTKADNLVTETTVYVLSPEETITYPDRDSYAGKYMDIPGFSDCVMSGDSHDFNLYNPDNNDCLLQYSIKVSDQLVYESKPLAHGESETADFYNRLQSGKYSMTVQTTGYSKDCKTKFNTVNQTIELYVY